VTALSRNVDFNITDHFGKYVRVSVDDGDIPLNSSGAFVYHITADDDVNNVRLFNKTGTFCLAPDTCVPSPSPFLP
jgi:hypothetical protein